MTIIIMILNTDDNNDNAPTAIITTNINSII